MSVSFSDTGSIFPHVNARDESGRTIQPRQRSDFDEIGEIPPIGEQKCRDPSHSGYCGKGKN